MLYVGISDYLNLLTNGNHEFFCEDAVNGIRSGVILFNGIQYCGELHFVNIKLVKSTA